MTGGVMNLVTACWRPVERYLHGSTDVVEEGREGPLWYRDIGKHVAGEFSMAVAQANHVVEDQSQVESGPFGTFVDIYDGHGDPEATRYVNDHLFGHLQKFASEQQGMSADVIRKAFAATEEGFLSLVRKAWPTKPEIAAVGSCCLVGVVHERTLYVANLGDSCVVMGRLVRATGEIAAVQLSTEHNANIEAVRQELRSLHPNDAHIVVLKHGIWRVKGIIQVLVGLSTMAFGMVRMWQSRSFQKYSKELIDTFRKEVALMKKLRHPNILLFMGAVTSPEWLCIVTEFLPRELLV